MSLARFPEKQVIRGAAWAYDGRFSFTRYGADRTTARRGGILGFRFLRRTT